MVFLLLSSAGTQDKKYLANERDVKAGRYRFLYSCPEALVCGERWKQLLLEPPLSSTVVAVAVDKAHWCINGECTHLIIVCTLWVV